MQGFLFGFLLNLVLTAWMVYPFPSKRPIIGVVLETVEHSDVMQAMQTTYKAFIEQAGAGAVPIFLNQSDEYYDKLFSRINGALLPGGGVNLISSFYGKVAYRLFEHGKASNDKGNYFPIWGTCLGMQEMTTWPFSPRVNPMSTCKGTEDVSLPLNFTSAALTSRMYKNLPKNLRDGLSRYPLTPNFHHYCLSMRNYSRQKSLTNFYTVTSTNVDAAGLVFASSIEARDYPFYGVQWHPEKNNFWPSVNHLNQSALAVQVSQYCADFLAQEASKSNNSFKSYDEEGRFLFDNYQITFSSTRQSGHFYLRRDQAPEFDN